MNCRTPPDVQHRSPMTLVTGGGGFLGRAIVERLLTRGQRVRSFARGSYPELEELGVETRRGDLADAEAVRAACAGCGLVFHAAAKAGVWGPYEEYHRANVLGTENVIAACRSERVGRLVFTSSPSVVFDGGHMEGVDESAPYPRRHLSNYSATKAAAERAVLAANGPELRTVALRPHLIWGPRDNHIVPRIVARGRAGKLRIVGRGDNRVDTIYIDNAADAHLRAADRLADSPNVAGRAFFLSQGEPVVLWQFINRILAAADVTPIRRSVPVGLARLTGTLFEIVWTLLRLKGEPRMTRFVAYQLGTSHWFDISAARRELGYEPKVSINEGLRRLQDWLRENTGD